MNEPPTSPNDQVSPAPQEEEGTCPACGAKEDLKTEDGRTLKPEIGGVIVCKQCGAELEVVGLEPLRLELFEEAK